MKEYLYEYKTSFISTTIVSFSVIVVVLFFTYSTKDLNLKEILSMACLITMRVFFILIIFAYINKNKSIKI